MFKINKNDNLLQNNKELLDIVQSFRERELPKLQKYYDYYKGNQSILNKKYSDTSKPCNHIVKNYCYSIVNNYLGYITGIPVTYSSKEDITNLLDMFSYNDIQNADTELLRNALIYGVANEVYYVDEDGNSRFKTIDSRECIPVYDDTLNENLLYMIRYYRVNDDKSIIEVYDSNYRTVYETNDELNKLSFIEQIPHYFKEVPFTVFSLNKEQESIFDKIMSLQDAYNELLSSEVDDFQAFTDAYLVLKGTGIEEDDIPQMRENRILLMDEEDSAEYLTKNISDTQIENMLKNLNDSIHVISNSPDFNDEKFMATSGIAMRYKLVGFENTSSAIISNMIKALQKRIKLLYKILGLVNEDVYKDVEISFTRNLPKDNTEIISIINGLRGVISDKTLIGLLPFINNVDAELEAIQEQKASNMNIYSFESKEDDIDE